MFLWKLSENYKKCFEWSIPNQTVFLAYCFRLRVRLTFSQKNVKYLNVEKKVVEESWKYWIILGHKYVQPKIFLKGMKLNWHISKVEQGLK